MRFASTHTILFLHSYSFLRNKTKQKQHKETSNSVTFKETKARMLRCKNRAALAARCYPMFPQFPVFFHPCVPEVLQAVRIRLIPLEVWALNQTDERAVLFVREMNERYFSTALVLFSPFSFLSVWSGPNNYVKIRLSSPRENSACNTNK